MSKLTHIDQLPDVMDQMLAEFQKASFDVRQKAVQAGAEVLKEALEQDTPRSGEAGAAHMADSWEIETQYPNHRYVGNTKNAKGVVHRKSKKGKKGEARENVPLSNVLEYAENSPHQGFIRRCFDRNENKIFETIKNVIENGG